MRGRRKWVSGMTDFPIPLPFCLFWSLVPITEQPNFVLVECLVIDVGKIAGEAKFAIWLPFNVSNFLLLNAFGKSRVHVI